MHAFELLLMIPIVLLAMAVPVVMIVGLVLIYQKVSRIERFLLAGEETKRPSGTAKS